MKKFKSLGELRGYSSIDITSKSVDEISKYVTEHYNKDGNINFPLKEGVMMLKFDGKSLDLPTFLNEELEKCRFYIYFNAIEHEQIQSIQVFMESYLYDVKTFELIPLNASEVIYDSKLGLGINNLEYEAEDNSTMKALMREHFKGDGKKLLFEMLFKSLMYVSIVQSNRNVVYKKTSGLSYRASSSTTKKKSNSYEKVEILNEDKVMYVLNGRKEAIKGFRTYTRKAESWNVMGHPRHYKNGKVIWIEPQVRGKGKLTPKSYKIK